MPNEVRDRVRILCNEIFCQKMPLPTEIVIMSEGNVRLEWYRSQAAPADALIQVYSARYAVAIEEDSPIKWEDSASEVCKLLIALFAGRFNPSLYDTRDEEIERIKSGT